MSNFLSLSSTLSLVAESEFSIDILAESADLFGCAVSICIGSTGPVDEVLLGSSLTRVSGVSIRMFVSAVDSVFGSSLIDGMLLDCSC